MKIKLINCFDEKQTFEVEEKPIALIILQSIAGDDVLTIYYKDKTSKCFDSDTHMRIGSLSGVDCERIFYNWQDFKKFIKKKGNTSLDNYEMDLW